MAEYAPSVLEGGFNPSLGRDDVPRQAASSERDSVAEDQERTAEDRERSLRFKAETLERKNKAAGEDAAGVESAVAAVQTIEALAKKAKNFRYGLMLVGVGQALSIYDLPGAFLQWNVQLLITIFASGKLKEFGGLPILGAVAVIAADVLLALVVTAILILAWAQAFPVQASCALGKFVLADGWLASSISAGCQALGIE